MAYCTAVTHLPSRGTPHVPLEPERWTSARRCLIERAPRTFLSVADERWGRKSYYGGSLGCLALVSTRLLEEGGAYAMRIPAGLPSQLQSNRSDLQAFHGVLDNVCEARERLAAASARLHHAVKATAEIGEALIQAWQPRPGPPNSIILQTKVTAIACIAQSNLVASYIAGR